MGLQNENFEREIARFEPRCAQEAADRELMLEYIRRFPDILTRGNRFAHLTSSGLILNASLDRMLLAYHNIYKSWAWTGGHADGDGDLLAVALREAREETGAQSVRPLSREIQTVDILPVWGHMKRGVFVSGHQHLNVSYALIADEDDALTVKPDENSGVRWFDVADIPLVTRSEPYMAGVYRRIVDGARAAAVKR